MRVAISFPFKPDAGSGGVESVALALVKALDELIDGDEEFVVACTEDYRARLSTLLRHRTRIVVRPEPCAQAKASWRRRAVSPATSLLLRLLWDTGHRHAWPELPLSDGFFEGLDIDLVHFPHQAFEVCSRPAVYNPHDLQHRHFPEYFSPGAIAWREVVYRGGCNLARVVVVASEWIRNDLIREFGVDPSRVVVIPWAPPTFMWQQPDRARCESVVGRLALPERYLLYPAMTWPHKNHARLLEAVALLKRSNRTPIAVVCTGAQTSHFRELEGQRHELGLETDVVFTGMLTPEDLVAVYAGSRGVVIPTLFEAASGPLFEAWQAGVPAAVARVTSLPEQAGGAAILFDPLGVEEIANACERILLDEPCRKQLVEAGRERLKEFTWERTANAYRAAYRAALDQSSLRIGAGAEGIGESPQGQPWGRRSP